MWSTSLRASPLCSSWVLITSTELPASPYEAARLVTTIAHEGSVLADVTRTTWRPSRPIS